VIFNTSSPHERERARERERERERGASTMQDDEANERQLPGAKRVGRAAKMRRI